MEAFESLLRQQVLRAAASGPTRLRDAMLHAVFSGGGRVRPKLGMAIVEAQGKTVDDPVLGAAMAVEMIHCASLVHDDMPCFDDADTRRGKPSIHRAFGEDTALLVGDALIVAAFEVLAERCASRPGLLAPMVRLLAEGTGASEGIIAGQASESNPSADVRTIHRKKTGALFEAIAAMAALVSGGAVARWRGVGTKIGMAYQLADDMLDRFGDTQSAGKPVDQDTRNRRPNAARSESLASAAVRLDDMVESAINDIPLCPGRDSLVSSIVGIATRLCPPERLPRNSGLLSGAFLSASRAPLSVLAGV